MGHFSGPCSITKWRYLRIPPTKVMRKKNAVHLQFRMVDITHLLLANWSSSYCTPTLLNHIIFDPRNFVGGINNQISQEGCESAMTYSSSFAQGTAAFLSRSFFARSAWQFVCENKNHIGHFGWPIVVFKNHTPATLGCGFQYLPSGKFGYYISMDYYWLYIYILYIKHTRSLQARWCKRESTGKSKMVSTSSGRKSFQ